MLKKLTDLHRNFVVTGGGSSYGFYRPVTVVPQGIDGSLFVVSHKEKRKSKEKDKRKTQNPLLFCRCGSSCVVTHPLTLGRVACICRSFRKSSSPLVIWVRGHMQCTSNTDNSDKRWFVCTHIAWSPRYVLAVQLKHLAGHLFI